MTYTLIVARLTMLSAGKSAYAQIPEAKNVPQDTVMYKTTYEVRQIIPPLYEAAGFFREGRARIKRDNKWGRIIFQDSEKRKVKPFGRLIVDWLDCWLNADRCILFR